MLGFFIVWVKEEANCINFNLSHLGLGMSLIYCQCCRPRSDFGFWSVWFGRRPLRWWTAAARNNFSYFSSESNSRRMTDSLTWLIKVLESTRFLLLILVNGGIGLKCWTVWFVVNSSSGWQGLDSISVSNQIYFLSVQHLCIQLNAECQCFLMENTLNWPDIQNRFFLQ